jgi:hypothetical protein
MRHARTAALTALALCIAAGPAAAAEKWLKIMPDDPFSKDGTFHLFDIDSAFEDAATGYVAARMTFTPPEKAAEGVVKWYVWAFDCKAKKVFYVSSPADSGGTKAEDGWRDKANALDKPVMGGVTNMFGKKLCALKGSWPKGALP